MNERGTTDLIDKDLIGIDLIDTDLIETGQPAGARAGLAEHGPGEPAGASAAAPAQADLDATLARTLRRFIAEVSKADQPQAPAEAAHKRAHPIREQGKRAAHLLWGKRDGQG